MIRSVTFSLPLPEYIFLLRNKSGDPANTLRGENDCSSLPHQQNVAKCLSCHESGGTEDRVS